MPAGGPTPAPVEIDKAGIPVIAPVRAVCDLLGLDPLEGANEGRCVAFLPAAAADRTLAVLRAGGCSWTVVAGRVTL